MGKHSKKRRRDSSSSSDEEYVLRKKLKQLKKRLIKIDKRNNKSTSLPSPSSPQRRSLSPAQSRIDSVSVGYTELEAQSEDGNCFDNNRFDDDPGGYTPVPLDSPRDDQLGPKINSGTENDSAQGSDLNQAVLSILGYDLTPTRNISPPFQNEVALSWTSILQKGITEDDRVALINKYAPPENCALLNAPKVNPEILSVTREVVARRDNKISDLQNQIGSALTALGQVLTKLLKNVEDENNISLVQQISDASRLLLDFHQKQSRSRRELISLDLKKDVRETLSSGQVDGWLFGDKLGERLKASREMERSGLELKPSRPKINNKNTAVAGTTQNLNFKRPLRSQGEYRGGRGRTIQNFNTSRRPKPYHQERRGVRKEQPHRGKYSRDRQ